MIWKNFGDVISAILFFSGGVVACCFFMTILPGFPYLAWACIIVGWFLAIKYGRPKKIQ